MSGGSDMPGGNERYHENPSEKQVSGPTHEPWTFCIRSCTPIRPPRSAFRRRTTSFEWRRTVGHAF
jgi:hypothetical protein